MRVKRILKFTGRIILNLALVPLILATLVSLFVDVLTKDDKRARVEDATVHTDIISVFGAGELAFLVTFLLVFMGMVVYMIVTRNNDKPSESETPVA